MNWDAIGAVGEIVGAVAVVVSLIYVGVQISRQTREQRLAAIHEATQNFMESLKPFNDPQVAELWLKGLDDFESLTQAEKVQMISVLTLNLRSFQDAFYQAAEDRLDEEVWDGMVQIYGTVLSTPGGKRIWDLRKGAFSRRFQKFFEEIPRSQYTVG